MSNSMNGITGGENTQLRILNPDGTLLNWTLLQNFTYAQKARIEERYVMNGPVMLPKFPGGWGGSFTFHRGNNAVLDYFIQEEANYYLGGDQLGCSIHHTIGEINANPTTIIFTNVVMILENGGDYSGTNTVELGVRWEASRINKS